MPNRHAGLPRAFDLGVAGYFLDFALVPIAIVCLMAISGSSDDLSDRAIFIATLAGILAWSLAEYWIHRVVFHGPTSFEPMHQMHHALPKDMIGLASWATFVGFSGIWLIAQVFAGTAIGSAITAGFMFGYLFYCTIHISMHHRGAFGFGRYGAMMLRLHAGHHRGGKGNFGVSSPIWDFVFRTYQPQK